MKDKNLKCVKNVTFGDIVTLYCHIHSHIISNQVLFVEKGSSSDKKEGWKLKYFIKVQFQIRVAQGNPTERANDPNQLIHLVLRYLSVVSDPSIGRDGIRVVGKNEKLESFKSEMKLVRLKLESSGRNWKARAEVGQYN